MKASNGYRMIEANNVKIYRRTDGTGGNRVYSFFATSHTQKTEYDHLLLEMSREELEQLRQQIDEILAQEQEEQNGNE